MPKIHFRPYIPNQTVLFPQRIDENIAENAPVRIINAVVDSLNLDNFKKLYKGTGRSPYHPKMMLKVILYWFGSYTIYHVLNQDSFFLKLKV